MRYWKTSGHILDDPDAYMMEESETRPPSGAGLVVEEVTEEEFLAYAKTVYDITHGVEKQEEQSNAD